MKKYIGVESFVAELVLVDPKVKMDENNDKKIDEFCDALCVMCHLPESEGKRSVNVKNAQKRMGGQYEKKSSV